MSDKPNMFDDEGCQYKCLVVDNLKAEVEKLTTKYKQIFEVLANTVDHAKRKQRGYSYLKEVWQDVADFITKELEKADALAELGDKKTKDSCPCGCLSGGIEGGEIVKQPCLLEGKE